MSEDLLMSLGAEAIRTMVYLAGPILLATMVVGLIVSVFQAVTQINEATLTFIPKLLAVMLVLAVMTPWMLQLMVDFAENIFGNFDRWLH